MRTHIRTFSQKATNVLDLAFLRELYGQAEEAFWEKLDEARIPDSYNVVKLQEALSAEMRVAFTTINVNIAHAIEEAIKNETPSERS